MKHIRCPKCGERVPFPIENFEPGEIATYVCPACERVLRIRLPKTSPPPEEEAEETPAPLARLSVLENVFHAKQDIPIIEGRNVVGRYVAGSNAGAAIQTADPSVDTTHCVLTATKRNDGSVNFSLQDAPSGTGTFVGGHLLGRRERATLNDGDIITIGATTMVFYANADEENDA